MFPKRMERQGMEHAAQPPPPSLLLSELFPRWQSRRRMEEVHVAMMEVPASVALGGCRGDRVRRCYLCFVSVCHQLHNY
jgi:hypothetical protein